MANNVFAVQSFFIVFRECLEATIILSVLFSFLKQCLGGPDQDHAVYKRLVKQVWAGAAAGVVVCLILGGAFIGVFYGLGKDIWSKSEDLWEGIFYLIATVIISIMGLALLRINKMKEKWRVKIAQALEQKTKSAKKRTRLSDWSKRYVMFLLPFITTLREGVEAVVFVGGVSLSLPATAFPLPVVCGIIAALIIGYFLYRGGNMLSIQVFLTISTAVLYLIAAGMFSKAIWYLQMHEYNVKTGGDAAESGSGAGSYNIKQTIWHVNCCNPETDNGWDIFNSLLGWQNTGTYGSVLSYIIYWIFLILTVCCLLYEEKTGSLPLQKQVVSVLLRVPVIGGHIRRKQEAAKTDVSEVLETVQAEGILNSKEGK
ncbi:unnamed protein product [Clonostachys solani]|uniref:Plasma membrane iron permease n=1 Tax=Clonostachys solani TaxID=160281 RepID=A0A9N9YZU5_9HYPO|nr:unnamed protein product [Clonostachys solani]